MSETVTPNRRRGGVRVWVGAGTLLLGSILAIHSVDRSTKLDTTGDELELAGDAFFDRVQDRDISAAVYKHIETTSSRADAELVAGRQHIPSETPQELAQGCKWGLPLMVEERSIEKCEQLGSALFEYRTASTAYDAQMDEVASAGSTAEVLGGGALLLTGLAVTISGIAASKKEN